jgi:hypothetical protein
VTAGAAHGPGIYLSDDINFSYHYGSSPKFNQTVIGVFEVLGNKADYMKTSQIYVVTDEKVLNIL